MSFKRAFFFYHQQCFKILQACQTSFQGLLHFLGTCWNKYLWGLFSIAIIPQDIINYYQYYYYYYLTRCEQKAYVQNLKMLSQGQLDVLHLKHFNFFIKQINSFQSVDLKKRTKQNNKKNNKQRKRGKSPSRDVAKRRLPAKFAGWERGDRRLKFGRRSPD